MESGHFVHGFIPGWQIRFITNVFLVVVGWRWPIQQCVRLAHGHDHRSVVSIFSSSVQSGLRCAIRCARCCCSQCDRTLSNFQLCSRCRRERFVDVVIALRNSIGHSSSTRQSEYIQQYVVRSVRLGLRRCASPFDSRCSPSSSSRC